MTCHVTLTLDLIGACRLHAEAGVAAGGGDVGGVQFVQLPEDLRRIHPLHVRTLRGGGGGEVAERDERGRRGRGRGGGGGREG